MTSTSSCPPCPILTPLPPPTGGLTLGDPMRFPPISIGIVPPSVILIDISPSRHAKCPLAPGGICGGWDPPGWDEGILVGEVFAWWILGTIGDDTGVVLLPSWEPTANCEPLAELFNNIVSGLPKKPSLISMSVGYGRLGSPCCHVRGAHAAFDAEIRWEYLIKSSDDTGFLFARSIESSFCFAWKMAVDKTVSASWKES